MTIADRPVRILAVAGSLRRESYNRSLLRAAMDLADPCVTISVYGGLGSVPVFNEDLEGPADEPPGVVELRRAVAAADGLLIATPEYNQSVPGVVKNMVDWLSRSESDAGLAGLPVAVTGTTTGSWGTRIAQTVLRQMLLSVQAVVLPSPHLFVPHAASLFDADGALTDSETKDRLADLVAAFRSWICLVGARADH